MAEKKQKPPESFEKALEELEGLVDDIEKGELPLEMSLELFDRASFLSRWCMDFLKNAEKKIKILLPDDNDDFTLESYEQEDSETG